MSDSGRPGFLSRWSQRKIQARESRLVRDEDQAVERPVATPSATEVPGRDRPGHEGPGAALPAGVAGDTSMPTRSDAPAQPGQVDENRLPSLEDVKLLTPDSDFSPFMARGVAPAVKNAAMKKLFADPHFNVMDGLDIYIDDYTQREVLPESMMRKMASSKFLKMFAEDDDAQPPMATQAAAGSQDCPQAASENSGPALTGVVSSPDEVRTGTPGTAASEEAPDAGSPDARMPPMALPLEGSSSSAVPGVRVPDGAREAGMQTSASLGVSPGLPEASAQVQNRSEASRTSVVKSEEPSGIAPSDAKPHERSN